MLRRVPQDQLTDRKNKKNNINNNTSVGAMSNDPADVRANARAEMGLSREVKQVRARESDPSRGGSRGYDIHDREWMLEHFARGGEVRASIRSLGRWQERLDRFRMTGNRDRSSLIGVDQLLLVLSILIYPDGNMDEMATFIYNEGGGLYTNRTISKQLHELQITQKVASTEAYQAFTPQNLLKAELFWTQPPPLGVISIPRRKFIDVDEFGVELNRCNRTRAWAVENFRIRKAGHYARTEKLTVLIGIEPGDPRLPANILGSIENPGRWIQVMRGTGTTIQVFDDFIKSINTSIENRVAANPAFPMDRHRVYLWDNLNSHLSPLIAQTLYGHIGDCRFTSVPRPPYQPKYGPIEYKICDLVHQLQIESKPEWDTATLEQEIYAAATRIGGFDATFDHCGYSVDGL
jgi:hypothetical protein